MTSEKSTSIVYKIKVQGELDQDWQDWFNGFVTAIESAGDPMPTTTINASITDQSALRGILCKLWDLNLVLISVQRIVVDNKKE